MKILQGGNNYHITGGSDRVMMETIDLLQKYGEEVIPFAPKKENNYATKWDRYFPESFDNKTAGFSGIFRYAYSSSAREKIVQLLDDQNIDIAHLHIYAGGLTTSIIKPLKEKGVPIIHSLHEYRLACPAYTMVSNDTICEACQGHKYYRAIPKKCLKGSMLKTGASVLESYFAKYMGAHELDHYIAVSQFMKDKMLQYNIGENKISVLHNFILPEKYKPNTNKGNYVLFFGRIEKLKGVFTLLEALEKTKLKGIFVGSGSDKVKLQEIVETRNLSNIEFIDFVDGPKLHEIIQNCLVSVVPSEWYENCPMTVLESLALGKPVIGSSIGGIPELIDHEKDGFLFEPGNVDELVEYLETIDQSATLAQEFGILGRKKIETKFGPEAYYKKLINIYTNLL